MIENERLRLLAAEALEHFDIPNARLTLLKTSNNIIYRVDIAGERYALRIHQPAKRKQAWIESELKWLEAIRRDTDLHVPEPVAPLHLIQSGEKPTYCTLLHWVDGNQMIPSDTTPEQAQQVGSFIANLHKHSIAFTAPPEFELPHLDWDGMVGDQSPYKTDDSDDLFSNDERAILNQIGQQVQDIMGKLDQEPSGFGMIHADLIWKNILFNQGMVGAIDFDDCTFGYYLYDLAPVLLGYMDEPNYAELRSAIWDGYTSVHPLPDSFSDYLDTLVAGRYTLSCHWIAANRHNPAIDGRAPEIIAYRISELRRYLQTGKLRRGEIII